MNTLYECIQELLTTYGDNDIYWEKTGECQTLSEAAHRLQRAQVRGFFVENDCIYMKGLLDIPEQCTAPAGSKTLIANLA